MRHHYLRGPIFSTIADPAEADGAAFFYYPDGLLEIGDGRIQRVAPFESADICPDDPAILHIDGLITPGFVDTHIHFPQIDMIASYGEKLLDWLERYTFPAEAVYSDPAHASDAAVFFLDQLLASGTTSALVFASVHKASVEALFTEALARDMRLIAGKVLMDRNVPEALRDTAEEGDADTRALIRDWHGRGRLGYAVTPRFAPACSDDQMRRAARTLSEHPDVLMQTHMSENLAEIDWVKSLYPDATSYLDVYDSFGLLTDRSVFAHCIHLSNAERKAMAQAGASAAFCPTSNLFLGSGLFDLAATEAAGVKVGLGTDVGAGTSFSLLQTLNEAYKVGQLQDAPLDPVKAFYLATLGGARVLGHGDKIGSLEAGKEADFIILDPKATPFLARRTAHVDQIEDLLFILATLGDDRAVKESWIAGTRAYRRA